VLPDGTLIDFFNEIVNFKNSEGGNQFELNLALIRSTDKGATWTRGPALRAAKILSIGVTDPETGHPIRAAEILFDVAVDPQSGNLYAVWQDARFSGGRHDTIAFTMSADGGFTWSTPVQINKTPSVGPFGNRQAFTPSVHVASDGTVAVTYYDFRNNTPDDASLLTDYWIIHCHPGASDCTNPTAWGDEIRLTDASFDLSEAPDARGYFVGDYAGLSSSGADVVAFFSQPHGTTDPSSTFFRRVGP
jgi:hypothetical protein